MCDRCRVPKCLWPSVLVHIVCDKGAQICATGVGCPNCLWPPVLVHIVGNKVPKMCATGCRVPKSICGCDRTIQHDGCRVTSRSHPDNNLAAVIARQLSNPDWKYDQSRMLPQKLDDFHRDIKYCGCDYPFRTEVVTNLV